MAKPQKYYDDIVIGKLKAEGLTLESEWNDIEACLSRVNSPDLCIGIAKRLIKEKRQDELMDMIDNRIHTMQVVEG